MTISWTGKSGTKVRAKLVDEKKLSDNRINNIMVVLSKSLRYAVDVELIDKAPKCRVKWVERAEIEAWTFEEYVRILDAAKRESPFWYAAICLGGEAGLRIGEIRALRWREDTMHFDFVESQSNLVPGGRSRINMNKERASPEHDLPDVVNVPSTPTPKPAKPPKGSVFDKPAPLAPMKQPTPIIQEPHPLAPPRTILDEE